MAQTLPVARLVKVDVTLSPLAAAGRNFGKLLIIGDSDVISGLERIRDFGNIDEVSSAFGSLAPETEAAQLYFSQSPKPAALAIGRWLRTASAGALQGQLLTPSQQSLANFNSITSGGFSIPINGSTVNVTGLDLSTATNLNAVASAVAAALAPATCVWTGSQFVVTSNTTGAGVKASGTITFTGNPLANDTVTVNGVVITFVAASPTGNQVLIGASGALTAVNLNTFLNASSNPSIAAGSYSVASGVVTVKYDTVGTAGNSFTLAESATNVAVSGATLSGGANASAVGYAVPPGAGQDISALLGLSSSTALAVVPGYDSETPLAAITALANISNDWYGSMFAASVQPTKDDNVAVAGYVEALEVTRVFGVTIQDTDAMSALVTDDLGSLLKALGYDQSFVDYSTTARFAVASAFGRAFSVDFTGTNTVINLMYKQMPGVVAENLSTSQANVLQDKRINVYAAYANDTNVFQYGTMAGSAFFDEIHGLDWLQDAIQTACFNVNYTSSTKVPQTDQGVNQFVAAIASVCDQAVANGLVAPGVWTADGFGQLLKGQYLKTGYYIYAQPVALQSDSDRAARKAPLIQVAVKLAGAINTVNVLVNVNR